MKKFYFLLTVLICAGYTIHAQWTTPNPGFTQATSIASISAPGSQVVWLAGRDTSQSVPGNRFARSINGGTSWTNFTVSGFSSYTPSNISAINADTAWVAMFNSTGGGGIFRTNNGGTTWVQQTSAAFTAPDGFPNVVHFFDANNGVCMGDPNGGYFEIYTTANGGTTWSRVPSSNIPTALTQEYGTVNKFSASGNLILFTTSKGRVFISRNKGLTWSLSTITIGNDTSYIHWMQPRNATELLAVCQHPVSNSYRLARSTDAGVTWQTSDWNGYLDFSSVGYSLIGANTGMYITLSGSSVHFSYDEGKNWRPLAVDLNNAGLYTEGAIATSPDGRIWLGGRYLGGSQTGLARYSRPSTDVAVLATQVSGGKVNCYGKDTLEVVLLNTGSSSLTFDTNPLNINFSIQSRVVGNNAFSLPFVLSQTVDSGVLNTGEVMVQRWQGGTLNAATAEYIIQTYLQQIGASSGNNWNDTTTSIYVNGPRIISLRDVSTGLPAVTLYKGTSAELNCSGAFNNIQWQSRTLTGSWSNEPGATSASYQFTAIETKYYRAVTCGGQVSDSILLTVPEVGRVIGYTYYDNQTNASINNRVQLFGNKISTVFTGSMDETNTTTPDRGTFYNHNNGTSWNAPATTRIESIRTGFPSFAITTTGKEIVVAHSAVSQKLSLLRRDSVGFGSWIEKLDVIKGQWPRIVAGSGDTLHVIAIDTPISQGAKIRYYRTTNAGDTWDIAVDLPGYTVANGFALTTAETYAIQAKGNVVVIVAGGYNNKLVLWKSVNSGQTWTTKTIKTFPAGFDGNTITPFTATTDGSVSVDIDNNNEANVFTGKMFLQDDIAGDGNWNYFPNTDGLLYWKESWATDSLVEIASAAITGYTPGVFVLSNAVGLCSYPSASSNKLTGTMFVTFSVPVAGTSDNTSDVNRRDVFGIMSNDGGTTWSVPQNLTQTALDGIDNSFASTVNNSNGTVHMLWQSSSTPVARNDGRINRKTITHEAIPYSSFESISLLPFANTSVCGNDSVDISYSSVGLFTTVTVQVSDANFSFNTPLILATFTNTNTLVTRRIKIPNSLKEGTYLIRVVGASGTLSDESNLIHITPLASKPVINTIRPLNFCNGDSAVLTVDTAQIGTYNHVWVMNGVIDSTSFNKLRYVVTTTANVQVYVNPSGCTVISDTVKTIRNTNQAISVTLTSDTVVCSGSVLTLKAIVLTGVPTSYQWRKNGNTIGTNSSNLVLNTVDSTATGTYTISINSQCAVYNSDTIDVRVSTTPTIINQPVSVTTCDGSNAVFRVGATSLTPLTYQWKKGSQILGTSDSLVIQNAAVTDTGEYSCTLTNRCGVTTTQVVTLTLTQALSINSVLSDTAVCKGNPLTLSVDVSGSNVSYKWFKDSTVVSTNAALSFGSVALSDSGSYYLMVTNSCGMLVSNIATLTVNEAAVVSVERVAGDTLRANVSGSYTSLKWFVNDTLISGATDTLLIATQSGSYTAEVASVNGCKNMSAPYTHVATAVDSYSTIERISVYPNPADGIVYVKGSTAQNGVVFITDLLGRTLLQQQMMGGAIQLNVSSLPVGIYILQVKTEKGQTLQKIQIQR